MGFFEKPKAKITTSTENMDNEANSTSEAAKKQRLLETEGKNLGAQLNSSQMQSVRRIFG